MYLCHVEIWLSGETKYVPISVKTVCMLIYILTMIQNASVNCARVRFQMGLDFPYDNINISVFKTCEPRA
jgi:hypothetical protein